jgi:hypothetical protein
LTITTIFEVKRLSFPLRRVRAAHPAPDRPAHPQRSNAQEQSGRLNPQSGDFTSLLPAGVSPDRLQASSSCSCHTFATDGPLSSLEIIHQV